MGLSRFFPSVLDASPVACFVIDTDHRVVLWNRACEVLTGVSGAEMVGSLDSWRPFYEAKRPVMADLVLRGAREDEVKGLYRGEFHASTVIPGSFEAESWFPHLGDSGRWLYFTAACLHDADGATIGAIETLQDITEHRRANEERRARNHRLTLLHTALDAADDAVVLTDAEGTVVWSSSAFTRLTGYEENEIRGNNLRMLKSGKQDEAVYRKLWQTILAGRVWRGELINRRKDGSLYPEDQTITPVLDTDGSGRISHFVAVKRNATERKQAEQAAAAEATMAYERLRGEILALFSRSHDPRATLSEALALLGQARDYPALAVYLYDEWYGVLICAASHGAADDLDYAVEMGEGLVGRVAVEQRMLSTAPADAPCSADAATLAWPIVFREHLIGVLTLNTTAPLPVSDREFVGGLCAELGVALHNMRQYEDLKELSEQLKERGQEITAKNAQLEQANRLKGEFLANMSHELRTPLNAVIGFSEVLRDELLGDLNDKQRDYVGEIFDSANHLLSLINDILDLSKIEAGKMELALEPFNVAEMLRNSLSIVKENAAAHDIRLIREISDDVGVFEVDGRKLRQVVYNLLSNAVKFTPDGGQVRLAAHCDGAHLCIDVTDTGIGIAEQDLPRLFRPFEQLDGSLSRQHEGTGLGLAMVKNLVEMHGGTVSVASSPGQGSRFSVVIPVSVEQAPVETPRPAASVARPPAGRGGPVLLVEDNDAAAQLMGEQLEGAGYVVIRASSGLEAVVLADQHRPALVVLDILLPDIDGWEVLRRLKEDSSLAAIPVLVVSVVADARKGFQLGALDVLQKPVRRGWLLDAVRRALPAAGDRPARVLVVDDDPKAIEFISAHLAHAGYEVVTADGGRKAIDLALAAPPDLIVLDLMMPEVTGLDVIAALRGDPLTRSVPVIILSAAQVSEHERAQLQNSVFEWVDKNTFDLDGFMAQIRQLALPQPPVAPEVAGERLFALVAVHDRSQSEMLERYLEDAGYDAHVTADARAALDWMSTRVPDLMVLDLTLPDMGSYTLLDARSARREWRSIPVVLVSATEDQGGGIPTEAMLCKPVQRTDLLRTLELIAPAGKNARRVLLIDDDPNAHKVIAGHLSGSAFELLSAIDGAQGLTIARGSHPDILLLDLMMPDMNGFEVLAALKADPLTRDIPVMILSAKLLTRQERESLAANVAAIAEKDRLGPTDLRKLIARAIGREQA